MEDCADCAICVQSLDTPGLGNQVLGCRHKFHEACLVDLRRRGGSGLCPICRKEVSELTGLPDVLDEAICAYIQGKDLQAFQQADEAFQLDPESNVANLLLAEMFWVGRGTSKNEERAREHFAVCADSDIALAQNNLAIFAMEDGDASRAQQLLERLPHVPEAVCNLASVLASQGHIDQAEKLFRRARQSKVPAASYGLAVLARRQGRHSDAKKFLRDGHSLRHALSTVQLAQMYIRESESQEGNLSGFVMAEELLKEAQSWGGHEASTTLALLYLKHRPDCQAEATILLQEAARAGNALARAALQHLRDETGAESLTASRPHLRTLVMNHGSHVIKLKFKRSSTKFLEVFKTAPELESLRQALRDRNYNFILDDSHSNAKMLVLPDHYEAVLQALSSRRERLYADNVIVEPHLESLIIELLQRVTNQDASVVIDLPEAHDVDLPEAHAMKQMNDPLYPIRVKRTFIQLDIASSLLSEGDIP